MKKQCFALLIVFGLYQCSRGVKFPKDCSSSPSVTCNQSGWAVLPIDRKANCDGNNCELKLLDQDSTYQENVSGRDNVTVACNQTTYYIAKHWINSPDETIICYILQNITEPEQFRNDSNKDNKENKELHPRNRLFLLIPMTPVFVIAVFMIVVPVHNNGRN